MQEEEIQTLHAAAKSEILRKSKFNSDEVKVLEDHNALEKIIANSIDLNVKKEHTFGDKTW